MANRAQFITFESIDGLGKTTQTKKLAEFLTTCNLTVKTTSEPRGTVLGAEVSKIIFESSVLGNLALGVSDLLFLACHIQNEAEVRKDLYSYDFILCDRYADSQFAYAERLTKPSPDWATKLFQNFYGYPPDYIIFLYTDDVSWALDRANKRKNSIQQSSKIWNTLEDQKVVQESYIRSFEGRPNIIKIEVKESDTQDNIHFKILNRLRNLNIII